MMNKMGTLKQMTNKNKKTTGERLHVNQSVEHFNRLIIESKVKVMMTIEHCWLIDPTGYLRIVPPS